MTVEGSGGHSGNRDRARLGEEPQAPQHPRREPSLAGEQVRDAGALQQDTTEFMPPDVRARFIELFQPPSDHPAFPEIMGALDAAHAAGADVDECSKHVRRALGLLYGSDASGRYVQRADEAHERDTFVFRTVEGGTQYRVVATLGCGGFGEVFLARNVSPDAVEQGLEVIKVLKSPPVAPEVQGASWASTVAGEMEQHALQRFEREVRALRLLTRTYHSQLIAAPRFLRQGVHQRQGQGQQDRSHWAYYAVEFIPGLTLKQLVEGGKGRTLPLQAAADIYALGLASLAQMHEQHVIHRDIKPANILLGSDGSCRFIDYGLARIGGVTDDLESAWRDATVTSTGVIIGTCDFISPEQAAGRKAVPSSDLHSLTQGAFHYLLTGKKLFGGNVPAAVLPKFAAEEPTEALSVLRKILSAEGRQGERLLRLLHRVFSTDSDDRPDPREVGEALLPITTFGRGRQQYSFGEFCDDVLQRRCRLRLAEEAQGEEVDDRRLLSGFPESCGDSGAQEMFSAVERQYPQARAVASETRRKVQRLLVPAVAVVALAAAAGVAMLISSGRRPQGEEAEMVPGAAARLSPSEQQPTIRLQGKQVFLGSEALSGEVEQGVLRKLTFFGGLPCEIVLPEGAFVAHTSGGRVRAVTSFISSATVARLLGCKEDDLHDRYKQNKGIAVIVLVDPERRLQYVYFEQLAQEVFAERGTGQLAPKRIYIDPEPMGGGRNKRDGMKSVLRPEDGYQYPEATGDYMTDPDIVRTVHEFPVQGLDPPVGEAALQSRRTLAGFIEGSRKLFEGARSASK